MTQSFQDLNPYESPEIVRAELVYEKYPEPKMPWYYAPPLLWWVGGSCALVIGGFLLLLLLSNL